MADLCTTLALISPTRRWGRAVSVVAAVCALVVLSASPADAALKNQYWYNTLGLQQSWAITKGAGVTVAVIDSGVVSSLGDLKGNVLPGTNLIGSGNGDSDPGEQCDKLGCYSHGTDMALLIAGSGKGSGFQGIAPESTILPIKIERQTTQTSDISSSVLAQGVSYAVNHGAQIINISLAGPTPCDPQVGQAIKNAYDHGVIVVAGAGNEGANTVESPANCPGALAVSGEQYTKGDGPISLWSKSNYGPEVDFTAPGTNLPQELTPTGDTVCCGVGTSQATAILSGTLALLRAHFPKLSARQIVTHAIEGAHTGTGHAPTGARINDRIGYGEAIPYYALTDTVPANFPNHIYDTWAKQLGSSTGHSTGSTSTPSGAAPSPPRDSSPVTTPSRTGGPPVTAPSPPRTTASGSSSSNTGVIIAVTIGIAVLAAIALGITLNRRSRHPRV